MRWEAHRFIRRHAFSLDAFDDVLQDAALVLMEACLEMDAPPVTWKPFARIVIRRRLLSLYFGGWKKHDRRLAHYTALQPEDEEKHDAIATEHVAAVENRVTIESLLQRYARWRDGHSFTTRKAVSDTAEARKQRRQAFIDFGKKVVRRDL